MIFNSKKWFTLLFEECFGDACLQTPATPTGEYYLLESTQLGWLKRWESLTNFYSQHYAPLPPGASSAEMPTLTEHALVNGVGVLKLDYILAHSPHYETLHHELCGAGFFVRTEMRYENWILRTAGLRYEDYQRSRSSRLRNTIRRARKKLDQIGVVTFTVHSQDDEELTNAIAEYHRIYTASWKEAEASPDFVSRLIRLCAVRGELCLGVLRVSGQPVAVQLWIVTDDTACIYKLAYDPEYSRYSVGTILTDFLIAQVFNRVSIIDYGTGSESYKKEWMTEKREYVRIWAASRHTLGGKLIGCYWRTRDLTKKYLYPNGVSGVLRRAFARS